MLTRVMDALIECLYLLAFVALAAAGTLFWGL
jgi:hypothetical protein